MREALRADFPVGDPSRESHSKWSEALSTHLDRAEASGFVQRSTLAFDASVPMTSVQTNGDGFMTTHGSSALRLAADAASKLAASRPAVTKIAQQR